MNEAELLVLKLRLSHETYLKMISMYLTWYAFYWTLNLAALGWVSGWSAGALRVVTGGGFGLAAAAATITSFKVLHSATQLASDISSLSTRLATIVQLDTNDETDYGSRVKAICSEGGMPGTLVTYGLRVNGWCTLLLAILWAVIGLTMLGR